MARTLHVVTHPQATHHLDGLVGGWHDSDLTAAGVRAAGTIARALRAAIPDDAQPAVISSDLRRARRTADAVADLLGVRSTLDRRLREKSYGAAEGRPQQWLDRRFVAPPAVGDRLTHDEGVPGAETRAAFAGRIYAAVDEILRQPRSHQVIVTHGFALTFVVASWIRMPLNSVGYVSFPVASGSITTLREDDFFHGRQVVSLGDIRHLETGDAGIP